MILVALLWRGGPVRVCGGRKALLGRLEGAETRAEETKSEKRQTPDGMERHIVPLRSMTLIEISVDRLRRVAKEIYHASPKRLFLLFEAPCLRHTQYAH